MEKIYQQNETLDSPTLSNTCLLTTHIDSDDYLRLNLTIKMYFAIDGLILTNGVYNISL